MRDAVIVITGASSGIGRATALGFARQGARLVLAARRQEVLEGLARECEAHGGEPLVVACDTSEDGSGDRLAAAAIERWGRIDVWVNNAAVALYTAFGEEPAADLRRVIEVNATGTALLSRAAVRQFRQQGDGVLINVGSVLSYLPSPAQVAYVMSKHAIRGLSSSLRTELFDAPNVHICTVLPGSVDTPLFDHAANFTGRTVRAMAPALAPEKVAAAILSCARRPRREVRVGWAPRLGIPAFKLLPRLTERITARTVERGHFTEQPAPPTSGSLHHPLPGGTTASGGWRRAQSPTVRRIAASAGVLALVALLFGGRR